MGSMARIAVVDDNNDAREMIRIWLETSHEVVDFDNGGAFLDAMKVDNFDVALLEVKMPRVDGITIAGIIRERFGTRLPLIAMTAHVVKGIDEALYRAGFDEVITKPMDLRLLSTVISGRLSLLSRNSAVTG